jgi:hypothetical protein
MVYILVRYRAESSGPDHQRLKLLAEFCQRVPEVLQLTLLSLWEEAESEIGELSSCALYDSAGCPCRKVVGSEPADLPDDATEKPA